VILRSKTSAALGLTALVASLGLAQVAGADPLETAVALTMKVNDEAAASQKRIDKLNDATRDLVAEYRSVNQQIDSLKVYNRQLENLITSQENEMVSLQQQIDNATQVAREITPLMLRMLDNLEKFVELDVPFLLEERRERIARLRKIMDRSDVSESEKFRQLLEAYQIENDYGRTIEAYKGSREGEDRTLNFLKVGRVVLVSQTPDESEIEVWNQSQGAWEPLPGSYKTAVEKGLRIARKQTAPDLLRLPVTAPEDAQ
jgi:hypothetical protein